MKILARRATAPSDGDRNREESARRSREKSQAARDIGELPPVVNPARKAMCARDFKAFCLAYFPHTFPLPFSADHLKVIVKIESAVLRGDLFAVAMPRGSGKTTLSELAGLWSILYGHHPYVVLIGAAADNARQMLESIKSELENNDTLLEDFPEVVFPIQALEGEPRRCKGQTYRGERTLSQWSADKIVFPTIPGSQGSGAVMRVVGITASFRGLKHKLSSGKSIRPSLCIPDDPQSDESAMSDSQCNTRERTLAGAVLGLAGPGRKIAGIMPMTVVRAGDLADRMLDTKRHPEWNGSRFKLVYSFPTDAQKWATYREILNGYNPDLPGDKERAFQAATCFYLENHEAMDAGASVAWAERFNPDELSAIQHAMNLRFRDERAFFAEYQNEPLPELTDGIDELKPDQIAGKLNRLPRGVVPIGATRITAFIDVQQTALYWLVAAWEDDFTGYVIDYGTYPDQKRAYFTLSEIQRTLAAETKVEGLEGQLYAGLTGATDLLLARDWQQEGGGGSLRIERCMIDANWGQSTDVVYQFCRQSAHSGVLMPSHGKYVGASSKPIIDRTKKPGERIGLQWVIPVATKRAVRHAIYDTNYWKSLVSSRWRVGMGARGCMSVFGTATELHRMFADHLTSEYRVRTEGRGRQVDEWKARPGAENHWFDCVVGAAVAASIQGVSLERVHQAESRPAKRQRMSLADLQAKAKQG